MIEKCIADWHEYIIGKKPGGLEALIADECVFISPIVFKPQVGKDLTLAYLRAAGGTLGGQGTPGEDKPAENSGKFKYTKEILAGNHAMLEFETEMDGKYVNGVDIITCNDEGKIIEFKVMIRPPSGRQCGSCCYGCDVGKNESCLGASRRPIEKARSLAGFFCGQTKN